MRAFEFGRPPLTPNCTALHVITDLGRGVGPSVHHKPQAGRRSCNEKTTPFSGVGAFDENIGLCRLRSSSRNDVVTVRGKALQNSESQEFAA